MKKISTGIKASAVYTLSSLINKGISFITIPIFTRMMSTEQIGIVNTYGSWHSILNVFACLSLTAGSFSIAMHQYRDSRSEYESAALGLTTVSSLVLFVLYAIFSRQIHEVIGLPWQLCLLMLIGFVVQPATDFWFARQRFEYKYKLSAFISSASAILSAALTIGVVLFYNKNGYSQIAVGRLYATYIVYYAVAIVLYVHIFREGKTFYNKEYWKFGLSLSIPLIFHSLSKQILDVSDRIMIQKIVGYSAVGVYGTLYSISSLSLIVWNAINLSLVPFTFSNFEKGIDGEKRVSSIITPIMVVFGVVAIVFAFLSPEIVRIIATQEYYEAIYMVPPVAAGIYFTSLYNMMGNVLLFHKKTKHIMVATMIAAALNIGLNYVFINRYGYMAAAYTTLAASIALAFLQYLMAKKEHGYIPYNKKALLLISFAVTIIVLSCNILYQHTILRWTIIGIIFFCCIIFKNRIINLFKQVMGKS